MCEYDEINEISNLLASQEDTQFQNDHDKAIKEDENIRIMQTIQEKAIVIKDDKQTEFHKIVRAEIDGYHCMICPDLENVVVKFNGYAYSDSDGHSYHCYTSDNNNNT